MGILDRLGRSLKANLNSVIDKAEDPAKMITQTIEDMQDELKKARQEVVQALASEKQLSRKTADLVTESEGWERKAMMALEHGDEELAREALKRKKKAEGDAVETDKLRGQQEGYVSELRASIEMLERKVEELKARKGALAAQVSRARTGPSTEAFGESGPASPALSRLREMQGKIEDMEAEVEAHNILDDPKRAEVEAKFRKLERGETKDQLDDELAALKKRLKK
jgi:phage shock protein A